MHSAYVSTTRRIELQDLKSTGALVTTLEPGESIAWQMTDSAAYGEGTVLDSGSGTHDSRTAFAGTWYANVSLPATKQTVHIHWVVSIDGADEYFKDAIVVKERT